MGSTPILPTNHSLLTLYIMKIKSEPLKRFYHCSYTNTIRCYPENYWIASIKDGEVVFDSWDGAIIGRFSRDDVLSMWKQVKTRRLQDRNLSDRERIAVIVKTDDYCGIFGRKNHYGIQFWKDWQVRNLVQDNTDGSRSYFVALLNV